MLRITIVALSCISFVLAEAQIKNSKIAVRKDGMRYSPVEPSIVINRRHPENIIAGVVLDRVIYTQDGGMSWQETQLKSSLGVSGDPALVSDSKGNIYYFHLADPSGQGRSNDAWLDRIVVQKSGDGGKTWDEGKTIGLNPPKDQDKPWPAVHPRKSQVAVTWTQFDKYGSTDKACQSNILFSQSSGKKWSKPVQINQNPGNCIDDDDTAEGAVPAIALDGKMYVAWSNGGYIYFDRSFNEGKTWLTNDLVVTEHKGGWSMKIPGLSRCNGMPVLMVDSSPSRMQGTLFLVWADQRNGEDDTDIWFSRSTNYGDLWTPPLRINKDGPGKHQFLPWMAVDQTTGYVYIVYYDRRAYDDHQTDVYLAYSTDGGANFIETKISESPFVPTADKFFGDYNNISAHKGIIAPIWTRMDNGESSVWTAVIKESELIKK